MNGAQEEVAGKLEAAIRCDNGFFDLGQQQIAPDRRIRGRDQEPMVAAGVRSGDGSGSEAAKAVGLQPLPRKRFVERVADLRSEPDHAADFRFLRGNGSGIALGVRIVEEPAIGLGDAVTQ